MRIADARERLTGRADPLVPPRRLQFVGNSDFRATGEEFRGHFRGFARLSRQDRVLDVGCGSGRMARVMATELAPPSGSYDGFDVVHEGIEWCQSHYEEMPVPFRFVHADVYHPEYNPTGTEDPRFFRFLYADASFDLRNRDLWYSRICLKTRRNGICEK